MFVQLVIPNRVAGGRWKRRADAKRIKEVNRGSYIRESNWI